MNIIIPIEGIGQRFKDEGYTTPKPLVKRWYAGLFLD
jgi:hypothetical protein